MLSLFIVYPSQTLLTNIQVRVALPGGILAAQPPWKTVWALHPALADGNIFLEGLNAGELVDKFGFALVAPSLGNGYFVNSGCQNQADFLEELRENLPEILPLAKERDANAALGISMGAYGAMRWALDSNAFKNVMAISGVYDPDLPPDERLSQNRAQKALNRVMLPVMRKCLQDTNGKIRQKANIIAMLEGHKGIKPDIWLYCGERDYISLLQTDHLGQLCKARGFACHISMESGSHDLDYWRGAFAEAIRNCMDNG